MSIQTYTFYEQGVIPGIPGIFPAGTQVDVDTSTNMVLATRTVGGVPPSSIVSFSSFYINVVDKGAVGDGVHDDTAAIQAAINQAAGGVTDGTNTVGGMVIFPPGIYLHTGLILYSFIHLVGSGVNATMLKLKNNSNADCIQGYNAPSLIGGSSSGGIVNWSIRDLIIDGNKSNQSATSYGIRQYGYGFWIDKVIIRNTYSDLVRSDWNGGSASANDSMEAKVRDCKFHGSGTGAMGLNWTGPHDSTIQACEVYQTGSHAFYVGPNSTGMKFTNCHGYNLATGVNAVTWLIEATGFQGTNNVAEGSDVCNVVFLAGKFNWSSGSNFCFNTGTPTNNVGGFQIGQQAGLTPYPGSTLQSGGLTTAVAPTHYSIDGLLSKTEWANGAVWFANDGGGGFVRGPVNLETNANPNKTFSGSAHASTRISLIPNGITPDGTGAKGGWEKIGISANKALTVSNATGTDYFNINTSGTRAEFPNAMGIRQYSDNYSTRTVEISGGTISVLQSASAAVTASSGTITTSGVGVARVAPTGNITGVILQAGTLAGQTVFVVNESAFTVTFASSSSNVADAATSAIPANSARHFVWDSAVSLWYRIA